MTAGHPAHPTHPRRRGAPLPKGGNDLPILRRTDIEDELERAEVELLYALARHRKAWSRMRAHAERREALADLGTPGALSSLEADPVWKNRTGDVSWWRDEVTAQSTAVLALNKMLEHRVTRPS